MPVSSSRWTTAIRPADTRTVRGGMPPIANGAPDRITYVPGRRLTRKPPLSPVVAVRTFTPPRRKTRTRPAAGSLHDPPAWQTGVVGDLPTAPRIPLGDAAEAVVASAPTATAAATTITRHMLRL